MSEFEQFLPSGDRLFVQDGNWTLKFWYYLTRYFSDEYVSPISADLAKYAEVTDKSFCLKQKALLRTDETSEISFDAIFELVLKIGSDRSSVLVFLLLFGSIEFLELVTGGMDGWMAAVPPRSIHLWSQQRRVSCGS